MSENGSPPRSGEDAPRGARDAAGAEAPAAPPKPDETIGSFFATSVVAVALVAAIGTFLFLIGSFGLEPNIRTVSALLGVDLLLILALLAIVIRQLWRLRRANRARAAGARLHLRVVGLFSLVAAVPTTIIAGAGLVALERGLTPWFSGDLSKLVQQAEVISRDFQQQICQNLGREMRLMAADLDRAMVSGFFLNNSQGFHAFINGRASALGFPYTVIFREDGTLVDRADITERTLDPPRPAPEDFRYAATDEPPCLFSREAIGGLIKLSSFGPDTYLMVARAIDPRMLEFPVVARSGVLQYQALEARRNATQFGIALVFALLTLIGLLAAVLLGLGFADRLVDPIRRLMQATDQVSAGNLYVQVPLAKIGSDLGQLGATFNNMTTVLREQRDSLVDASRVIDERRRFIEAMLAGVPAGVIGLDPEGRVSLMNPMARQILALDGREVHGAATDEILPEIDGFIAEARAAGAQRLVQHEATIRRRGKERTLSVRVTGDSADGLVITLDDITDLVTAQRSAAWADVARRIAHEIKNPLTPIQLSAERIRRKFGKVITEDRAVFDQCTDTIIRQVEDIKRMVDEFSSFARMPKPQPTDEDIVRVLREVIFMMRVGNPGVTFDEGLPEGPVMARFDRRLVAQAVQNLLKNACEAIAESPAGPAGTGRISVSLAEADAGEVVLDIRDNGKGFPRENRQRLLEPYMTTREGGTGLGLPIVAKIFEEHGGRIELLDPPAENGENPAGALVRIHLPRIARIETEPGRAAETGRPAPILQGE
jgi:two-component system nitrogen regulation sensor histidine kinase NtrY